VGLANLDLAYGDEITRAEKKAILKESMENLGILTAEFPHVQALHSGDPDDFFEVRNVENVDQTRGGIAISAHMSNWEWMAVILSIHNPNNCVVVRPLDNPRLYSEIRRLRGDTGLLMLDKKDTGTKIIKAVREGHMVGLLVDQSARSNGVPVNFFGQPCWATIGPVMVAMRAKAPIYPISMHREANGKYVLTCHPPITIERTGDIHRDLISNTQACQDAIEMIVREHPGQWMWIHKRWKKHRRMQDEWDKKLSKSKPDG
jgi:KDO2-lipid IV(A) lauroyltransferase